MLIITIFNTAFVVACIGSWLDAHYWLPDPNSRGVRIKSGANVLWFQGPTFNCGLGGSERIWRLAFFIVLPMVSIPVKKVAERRFCPRRSPLPAGFKLPHWLLVSRGRRSDGLATGRLVAPAEGAEPPPLCPVIASTAVYPPAPWAWGGAVF